MKVYFSRLWPSMKVIAFWFLVAAAVRIAFRLFAGTVSGGTPANIVIRVLGAIAVTALVCFLVAAAYDWLARREEEKSQADS